MRKSLIALLVLLALAVGLLAAVPTVVNRQETAVELTEDRHFGDPAAGEGLELTVKTTMNNQLHWTTTAALGPEVTWTTDFQSKPIRDTGYGEVQPYLYINTLGGVGVSTSYDSSIDFSDWDGDPFGPILADVASRAPAGTDDYTETIDLSDYLDYYPLSVDYYYKMATNWEGDDSFWPEVSEFFHIPVEGSTAVIKVSTNDQGGVYSVGWDQLTIPDFSTAAACVDGGAYLAIWGGYSEEGVAGPTTEGMAETGVYWVPIGTDGVDEYGNPVTRVDADNVRLVWQPEDGVCVGLWAVDGEKRLLAQVSSEDGEYMAVVGTAFMETVQTFPLQYDPSSWVQLEVQDDFVVTLTYRSEEQPDGTYAPVHQWVEAWYAEDGGVYEKAVSCDLLPAETEWNSNMTFWCDGDRLVLAEVADDYNDPSMDVAVCDGQGLQYAARLQHSQYWDPHPQNRVRPENGVTVSRTE